MLLARATRRLPLLVALCAALAACVQVDQTLLLEADGGGVLTVQYNMSREALLDLEARARALAEETGEVAPAPLTFDEAAIRADFKEYEGQGITLEEARAWEENERRFVRLRIRFASLQALGKTEFLSDRRVQLTRASDGSYVFTQQAPPSEPMPPEAHEWMRQLMEGFRAHLSVETPGPIVESNADRVEDRRATWIFDPALDANALVRAQQMDLRVRFRAERNLPEYVAP